ncbi:MAG TPA: helix-turn-helix transcriptional regulator [Puia sp.]|nr:helix-turn-helix transcriptional regulator [Puia sp.]
MKFTQIPAPDCLKRYVRYFWTLESTDGNSEARTFRTMADGCPGIIFQHPDDGAFHMENKPLPGMILYGQTTKHAELCLTGNFNTIGIYFYPHALKAVFGVNAEELTDDCMDLNLTGGTKDFFLPEQLSDAASALGQIEILTDYLCLQVGKNDRQPDELMQYAVSQLIHTKGNISLGALQNELRITERSFERRFKRHVGISSKLFSRICRFQASLAQLRNSDYDKLSDIAFENEYADQSHFIRSFKEFAGVSPNRYQEDYNEVVENFSELK